MVVQSGGSSGRGGGGGSHPANKWYQSPAQDRGARVGKTKGEGRGSKLGFNINSSLTF